MQKIGIFLRTLSMHIFNMIQTLHHRATDQEIELIKNTGLFENASEQQFKQIVRSVRLIKYPANKLVFNEGDIASSLYVIVKGSVRVFTLDTQGTIIPLARLNEGDYFGEQALLGQGNKTRNASIETITDTVLIQVNAKIIVPLWEEDHALKLRLKKMGYQQALHDLSSSIKLYKDIKPIIEHIENHTISEYKEGDVIFRAGDQPDNVYLILKGTVELQFPEKNGEKQKKIILHKGHLFGELGVMESKPRSATAISKNQVRLLAIEGEQFRMLYQDNPQLQHLLSILKQTYQLPTQGIVQQYLGSTENIGHTITNLFQMDDGRSIISVLTINEDIFTISVIGAEAKINYRHKKNDANFIILYVSDHRLVRIDSCGQWDSLAPACHALLNNEMLDDEALHHFELTGELGKKTPEIEDNPIICTCMSVTKNELEELINHGMSDFDSLSRETGAGTVCGSCRYKIMEMTGGSPWLSAIIKRTTQHNDYINSYIIKPLNQPIKKFLPGQHLIIQAKIHDNWVERAYTISGQEENGAVRVTIKKEPKGLFTQWLFNEAPETFEVNVTQPQGSFTLNQNPEIPALCFAGGIGITPFIIFVRELATPNKPVHIIYCALTNKDFIFKDEFKKVSQTIPSVLISYRPTDQAGLLTNQEIIKHVSTYGVPDIYICGPEGFESLIHKTLDKISYDEKKLHIEQFVHAGKK